MRDALRRVGVFDNADDAKILRRADIVRGGP